MVDATVVKSNRIRDGIAAALLVLGLLLPWSVYFGVTISGFAGWVLALLIVATLASLLSLVFGLMAPESPARLRLLLNIPYLALGAGFVVATVIEAFRTGGTVEVAPGIGPGAWLGVAGAVLAAQPVIAPSVEGGDAFGAKVSRIIGVLSIALAVVAVVSNIYWRTRFVASGMGDSETATQNIVVFVAALLYGVVALVPVVVVGRWLLSASAPSRFATFVVGASALLAGVFVWLLPIGRELDAFHGIAQNTSTAGVGFEGYFAWVIVAAIVGTSVFAALSASGFGSSVAREAVGKCLLLIAIWCGSAAVLRILDVMSASALDLPASPYNSSMMMVFDLIAALLAMWIFINGRGEAATKPITKVLLAALLAATVARLIVDFALVPRYRPLISTDVNEVYGNTLSQQITSTFDVALCLVALALLVITVLAARPRAAAPVPSPQQVAQPTAVDPQTTVLESPQTVVLESPETTVLDSPVTTVLDPPTIARIVEEPSAEDKVAEALAQSTQRFAAGSTYQPGNKSED